jgi:hypothetical protein
MLNFEESGKLDIDGLSSRDQCLIYNEVMNFLSADAGVLFSSLPLPPSSKGSQPGAGIGVGNLREDSGGGDRQQYQRYIEDLDQLTKALPPILLTRGLMNVITTDL